MPTLMFEAAEPLNRPFNVDMPERAPSAARLAAEAFFAPAPDPSFEAPAPAVVVKKSKLEDPVPAVTGETPESGEQPREPRVFRLPTPVVPAGEPVVEAQATLGADAPDALELESQPIEEPRPAPRAVIRRRKRRVLHGEVTIMRPTAPASAAAAAPSVASTSTFDEKSAPLQAFAHQAAVAGQTSSVVATPQEWPRYLGMRRQLLALQAEARTVKAREARAALAWIKQAIAEYKLTPADLGLAR